MAETSGISWTKSTFNPWLGCSRVGPGCDHCYAEKLDATGRFGPPHWGPGVPRKRTSEGNWNEVRKWNKKAPGTEFAGRKGFWPVFSASLADIFDNEVDPAWRADFWALVRECPNLTFQVVTKRIGNAAKMLPADWGAGYPNVWLIATVVNQEEADRDIPKLRALPAVIRGLSIEPMLGPINLNLEWNNDLGRWDSSGRELPLRRIDWAICGGESGSKAQARPMDLAWAFSLREQCMTAGTAFFMKQLGSAAVMMLDGAALDPVTRAEISDRKGGDMASFPRELRVREFPIAN